MSNPTVKNVADRHRADAHHQVQAAEHKIAAGRRMMAEGQELAAQGERDVEAARLRLAMVEDFVAALTADLEEAVRRDNGNDVAAATVAEPSSAPASLAEARMSLSELLDGLLAGGEVHTVKELHEALSARGLTWSRQSVANRCSERARQGIYENVKRGAYRLAAKSGDSLPPGLAGPGGGERETGPEDGSQQGAGDAAELSGSMSV